MTQLTREETMVTTFINVLICVLIHVPIISPKQRLNVHFLDIEALFWGGFPISSLAEQLKSQEHL